MRQIPFFLILILNLILILICRRRRPPSEQISLKKQPTNNTIMKQAASQSSPNQADSSATVPNNTTETQQSLDEAVPPKSLSDTIDEWYWKFRMKDRKPRSLGTAELIRLRHLAGEYDILKRRLEEDRKPTIALWGLSAAGKSTLVESAIDCLQPPPPGGSQEPIDAEKSALEWYNKDPVVFREPGGDRKVKDKTVVWNPRNGERDATACITRFTLAKGKPKTGDERYPVEIKLLDKVSLLKALAAGYPYYAAEGSVEMPDQVITDKVLPADAPNSVNKQNAPIDKESHKQWADFVSIMEFVKKLGLGRYNKEGDLIDTLRGKQDIPKDIELASKTIFWNSDKEVSALYKKACAAIESYQDCKIYCSYKAASLFVDMYAYSKTRSDDKTEKREMAKAIRSLKFQVKDGVCRIGETGKNFFQGNPDDDLDAFAVFQTIIKELVVSINEDTLIENAAKNITPACGALKNLLDKGDLLDFPGISTIRGAQRNVYSVVAKLGKVLSAFSISAFESVDDFCILISCDRESRGDVNAGVKSLLAESVGFWKKSRKSNKNTVTAFTKIKDWLAAMDVSNSMGPLSPFFNEEGGFSHYGFLMDKMMAKCRFVHVPVSDHHSLGPKIVKSLAAYCKSKDKRYTDDHSRLDARFGQDSGWKNIVESGKEQDGRADLLNFLANKIDKSMTNSDIQSALDERAGQILDILNGVRHTGDTVRQEKYKADCTEIAKKLPEAIESQCKSDEAIRKLANMVFEFVKVDPKPFEEITGEFFQNSPFPERIRLRVETNTDSKITGLMGAKTTHWRKPEELKKLVEAFGLGGMPNSFWGNKTPVEWLGQSGVDFVEKFFAQLRPSLDPPATANNPNPAGEILSVGKFFFNFMQSERTLFRPAAVNPAARSAISRDINTHLALKMEDYLTGRLDVSKNGDPEWPASVPDNTQQDQKPDNTRARDSAKFSSHYEVMQRYLGRIKSIEKLEYSEDRLLNGDHELNDIITQIKTAGATTVAH